MNKLKLRFMMLVIQYIIAAPSIEMHDNAMKLYQDLQEEFDKL